MAERYQFPINETDRYSGTVAFQVINRVPQRTTPSLPRARADREMESAAQQLAEESSLFDIRSATSAFSRRINGFREIPGSVATLYLPQALSFNDGVEYANVDLGRIGAAAELALQNGGSIGSAVSQGLNQAAESWTQFLQANATRDAAALGATRLARTFTGDAVGNGVQSALQVTKNPNKRVLFREVPLREFTFNFKLIPTSKQEAEQITQLIRFFREELYPELADIPVAGDIPIGFKFPNKFRIRYRHRGSEIGHRILDSYLVSMNTVYNPNGMGFFEDGNLTETDVTMTFREGETLNKEKVREGF